MTDGLVKYIAEIRTAQESATTYRHQARDIALADAIEQRDAEITRLREALEIARQGGRSDGHYESNGLQ